MGGAPLLSVEKHLERQQKRQEKRDQRAYHRSRRQNAMFDVINRVMATGPEGECGGGRKGRREVVYGGEEAWSVKAGRRDQ